jgi:hypothetical protein
MPMLSLGEVTEIIAGGEQVGVEFKSDRRRLSDNDIYEEVVLLANSKGGFRSSVSRMTAEFPVPSTGMIMSRIHRNFNPPFLITLFQASTPVSLSS